MKVYPFTFRLINPIALRKAKAVWSFGLPECNRVKRLSYIVRPPDMTSDEMPQSGPLGEP